VIAYLLTVGVLLFLGWVVYDLGYDSGWMDGYNASRADHRAAQEAVDCPDQEM
jgi:hypothetical protein